MKIITKVNVHLDANQHLAVFTESGSDLDISRAQFVLSWDSLKAVLAQLLLAEVQQHQQLEQAKVDVLTNHTPT